MTTKAPQPFFSWRHAILESDLSSTTRLVLLVLSCHMNSLGQGAYPSVRTLARETGLSRKAVMEHLTRARKAGWIVVGERGFRGQIWRRHEYGICNPPEKVVTQGDHEGGHADGAKAVTQGDLSTSVNSSQRTHHVVDGVDDALRRLASK